MSREKKIAFGILGAAVVVMLILAIYGYSSGRLENGELTQPPDRLDFASFTPE